MTPEQAAAVLNLELPATPEEIESAFRRRARISHPDRFAGGSQADRDAAHDEFVRISAARDVLQVPPASQHRGKWTDSRPPSAPEAPMSFADFVSMREAMSWIDPPRQPAETQTTPPVRSASGLVWWLVSVGIVVVVLIVGALTSLAIGTDPSGGTTVPQSVSSSGDFEWYYAADSDPVWDRCMDEDGCWIWYVASPVDCVASMTFGFSRTEASAIVHTFDRDVVLESSQATPVVVGARLAADHEYGEIVDVQCY